MKLPKNERGKVGYYDAGGELRFVMAQKENGGFVLYKVEDDALIKLGKGADPNKLEESFKVRQTIMEER